jgi:hypothetical protein
MSDPDFPNPLPDFNGSEVCAVLLEIPPIFKDIWYSNQPKDLTSLTPDGPNSRSNRPVLQLRGEFRTIDKAILGKFQELGLLAQAGIVRKLLIYRHLRETMFVEFQNTITTIMRDRGEPSNRA